MKRRIKELEKLATNMVGDGKAPNVFFVSIQGRIILVTTDFAIAYNAWKHLDHKVEDCMEDRQYGVVCSTEPLDDPNDTKLYVHDDSHEYRQRYKYQE